MARTFFYSFVSPGQSVADDVQKIEEAGHKVESSFLITEEGEKMTAAADRPVLSGLIQRLEAGDSLVVAGLNSLGMNLADVRATVRRLAGAGVQVRCVTISNVDLGSTEGKFALSLIGSY
jgi:putative DNA-invertase from lambdoid prophage Rac